MALRLNNVDNRILLGNKPMNTVLLGNDVVYGESFRIIDFYYPALPKGIKSYTVYVNEKPVVISPENDGKIKVGLYDYVKVKAEKDDNYYNISDVKLYCGDKVYTNFEAIESESYTPTATSNTETVCFSVMSEAVKAINSPMRLELKSGSACGRRSIHLPVNSGVESIIYEFEASPWSQQNAQAVEKQIFLSEDISVIDGAKITLKTVKRKEGYILKNATLDVNGRKYGINDTLIVGDQNVNYNYSMKAGEKSFMRIPAAPTGILYEIKRIASEYGLSPNCTILVKENCGSAGIYSQTTDKTPIYEGDKVKLTISRKHSYTYAKFEMNGVYTQNAGGEFVLKSGENTLNVAELPRQGIATVFDNSGEEFGYSKFKVESEFFNEQLNGSYADRGVYELFVGDKIMSDGEGKISSNTMRISSDIAYRTPSVGLRKNDGTIIVQPTRAFVSYVMDEDGVNVVYEAGAKKVSAGTLGTKKFLKKGKYNTSIPYILCDGALEKAYVHSVRIDYYVKRYLGDGVTYLFPLKTVTVNAGESFSEDWNRTAGLLPPDSVKGVLEGDFSVTDSECTLEITCYLVGYVSDISSKGCSYTPLYLI